MKKIVGYIIYLIGLFLMVPSVYAASGSISISGASTAVVGNNVTFKVSLSQNCEAWNFSIGYDTSKLRLVSSTMESGGATSIGSSYTNSSRSYSLTFLTLASGSASVYVSDVEIYDASENLLSIPKSSKSITLKTKQEIQSSYSSNNALSSLSVDGLEITPKFSAATLEYSVNLAPETTSINIRATVADSNATVKGTGEHTVSEGENVLSIVVTAQNGSSRTYIVHATVQEYNPIVVEIDGEDYTVVRKKSLLTPPNNYDETTVLINGEEVIAYKGKITNYVLVGLKNQEGIIQFYIYDDGKYSLYKEYSFGKVVLYPIEIPKDKIKKGYKNTEILYNDEKIIAYKKKGVDYPLIYAVNIETGKSNFYSYDEEEGTVQIYNDSITNEYKDRIKDYKKLISILSGVSGLFFILFVVNMISNIKSNRKKKKMLDEIKMQFKDSDVEFNKDKKNKKRRKKSSEENFDVSDIKNTKDNDL